MAGHTTEAGARDPHEGGGASSRRISLGDVAKPRVTTLTIVTLALLGLSCVVTMAMVLYTAEPFDARFDDWFGIGALLVVIAMPYFLFAPVLVWLPRTLGESVLGLLAVLFIGGVGVAVNVDALFLSDNPLDLFVIAAMPWWQLMAIGIISALMALTRFVHWMLVGRGSAPRI